MSRKEEEKIVDINEAKAEILDAQEQFDVFLGQSPDITQIVKLPRFEGVDFVLKPIDGATMDQIQERATYYTKSKRNAQPRKKTDEQALQAGIIAHGVKSPDLQSEALKKKYNEADSINAIKRHFLAGELTQLTGDIMTLSGFNDDDFEEEVKKP